VSFRIETTLKIVDLDDEHQEAYRRANTVLTIQLFVFFVIADAALAAIIIAL